MPWLKKTVRNQDGEKVLYTIAHWQMIGNLRQSLLMPSLLFLIWMGFSLLPGGVSILNPSTDSYCFPDQRLLRRVL